LADDTEAIQHAIDDGQGSIDFPPGDYRITRSLHVQLAKTGRTALTGAGGTARLVMAGPGPAIFLEGTHQGSADPADFRATVLEECMPTVANLEIDGQHAQADGIRIEGVMQPSLTGLLIRHVRTAVHVSKRARNLLINGCHFYHNTAIGVHLDGVNLHQAIIAASHISYCRLGGVRIENSEIRNVQITGNDIEYNNHRGHKLPDTEAQPTAEIYIDARRGTVREGTIASNTIQATSSPGGANIRFIGSGEGTNHKAGMWTIVGNLIGSQETNVHLTSVRGITLTGNYIYSGHLRNLVVEGSRDVVVGANCFGHNPDYGDRELSTGVRFVDCENCTLTGVLIQDALAGEHTVPDTMPVPRDGLLEFIRCRRITMTGLQVLDGHPDGIHLQDCSDVLLSGCTVLESRDAKLMRTAIRWGGPGSGNHISGCRLGAGVEGAIAAAPHVSLANNAMDP
jgi:polygalacturonase